ncbi:MAG: hypothetical protein WBA13_08035 [Microcoleaceae cyanobacterium]
MFTQKSTQPREVWNILAPDSTRLLMRRSQTVLSNSASVVPCYGIKSQNGYGC